MKKQGVELKKMKTGMYSHHYVAVIGGVTVRFSKCNERTFRNGYSMWDGMRRVAMWGAYDASGNGRCYAEAQDTLEDAVKQAISRIAMSAKKGA